MTGIVKKSAEAIALRAFLQACADGGMDGGKMRDAMLEELDIVDQQRDAQRIDWLMRHLPGSTIMTLVGEMSYTGDAAEFRRRLDAAMAWRA